MTNTKFKTIPGTPYPMLELFPIRPEHADMLASWVSDEKAQCWLDLGGGRQCMASRELYLMLTNPRNHARLFRLPGEREPLGLVCLNDSKNLMGSAEVWGLRGSYTAGPRNLSVAAFLLILANGFVDLNRSVIGSWIVEGNALSIIMHKRLGLKQTGYQRARHIMNGKAHNRLLFDITREEFLDKFPHVPAESGNTILNSTQQTHATKTRELADA